MGLLVDTISFDTDHLFPLVVGLVAAYWSSIVLYRLFLSPLRCFPGPRLAALTYWTEAYYQLLHGEGGQFQFKYRQWHERYGPIIRINPRELHIQDAPFFETMYAFSKPASKLKDLEHRFNMPTSAFETSDPHIHRVRRAALNQFFSKRKISDRVPLINYHMDELCQRLRAEYQGTGRLLAVNDMFGCWIADIIIEYCFERQCTFIGEPEFKSAFVSSVFDMLEPVHWATQFPWMGRVMQMLPDSVLGWLNQQMKNMLDFQGELHVQVEDSLRSAQEKDTKNERPGTIFTSIINSDTPRSEVTSMRLQHEATSVVGAGIETTTRALSISIFHIANNPWIDKRLREELTAAIPDPDNIPTWEALEQLPFLSACVNESLRLAYGTSQRLPRVLETDSIVYKNHIIPPGTVVSMDIYDVHHDEDIFPDSHTYNPLRWLDADGCPARAPDGRLLSRYMVVFGRGPRACVGMQLAYAELFIGIARLIRRFEFELFETGMTDVVMARDCFVPRPGKGSKGVRVLVK
ncbi:cytochrome P450 [Aspergillus unguis]